MLAIHDRIRPYGCGDAKEGDVKYSQKKLHKLLAGNFVVSRPHKSIANSHYAASSQNQSSTSSAQLMECSQRTLTAISEKNSNLQQSVDALFDHQYAVSSPQQSSNIHLEMRSGRKGYKCENCPHWTVKKSSMVDHQSEYCISSKVNKTMKCPVCEKYFTYRGLRVHLNYYKSGKHDAKDGHSKYSRREHAAMLAEHIKLKNKSLNNYSSMQ